MQASADENSKAIAPSASEGGSPQGQDAHKKAATPDILDAALAGLGATAHRIADQRNILLSALRSIALCTDDPAIRNIAKEAIAEATSE